MKSEEIVAKAKTNRMNRGAKEVSNELIIYAAQYKTHPACKTPVCFIYGPDGFIKNPCGVESDLAGLSTEKLKVAAIIVP